MRSFAILVAAPLLALAAPAPQDASIMPIGNAELVTAAPLRSCTGADMTSMIWWTSGIPKSSPLSRQGASASAAAITGQIDTVRSAVVASGGQVKDEYNMEGYKGLHIVAPSAVQTLVGQVGKDLGFKIEKDGSMSIQQNQLQPPAKSAVTGGASAGISSSFGS